MVSKATNNSPHAANADKSKGADRRTPKKGSRVTEARAQAQRAKLDAQAQISQQREDQEAVARQTQHKKTVRQEMQAKRRVIATLIEAYIQDHIGGNSSEKTLEWHRTALGLLRLFLFETGRPLTKSGMALLFGRLRKRAGITRKGVSPSLLRESFAMRYLQAGGDLCTLWELLGQKENASFKHSLRRSDEVMANEKRKGS